MRLSACGSLSSLLAISVLLSGCALNNTAPPNSAAGIHLRGNIHGGQQPIVGAHVYLFASGTTGYGAASTSLLTSGTVGGDSLGQYVTTDANGSFSITGDYTCTSATQLYVLATQGNPGIPNQNNPNLALMAALGQCPAAGSIASGVPFVFVNEVTTVASVYALAGFMTDLAHVSSSGTPLAQAGIAQAFAAVNNLVTISTGAALATTPAGNGTVPQAEINTLANIIASCVNSVGASSVSCTALFANAQNGGTAPTDTVTAALNIAHNPGANVSTLFAIAPATAPFQPSLSSSPNDFTIALTFTGGGLSEPLGIAIDGAGDVWATSAYNSTSIAEFSGTGAVISPASGYTGGGVNSSMGIAIDNSGNVWATNDGPVGDRTVSDISKMSSAGVPLSPSTGYVLVPTSIFAGLAIEASGNVWIANNNPASLTELNGSSGAPISPSGGYTGGGLFQPQAIAIDNSGNVWVANYSPASVSLLNGSTGAPISPSTGYTGGGLNRATSIAIDSSDNIWIANGANIDVNTHQLTQSGSLTKLNGSTGAAISPSTGYVGNGSLIPIALAIDGAGNVWVGNASSPFCTQNCWSLVEFNGTTGGVISGSTGYTGGGLFQPGSIAIDGSGNVWTANGDAANDLTEFVGAAAPVVTPLATAVANHSIATRP
jgi:hypothetical protein